MQSDRFMLADDDDDEVESIVECKCMIKCGE